MNMANQRFKDDEIDRLNYLVENRDEFKGQFNEKRREFTDWSSEGKYTRNETTRETFVSDDNGIRVERKYKFVDDDGYSGGGEQTMNRARDILENTWFLKKKK